VRESQRRFSDVQLNAQGFMISSASILGDLNALKCELAGEVLASAGALRWRVT
jgi:hypothetical protein